MIIPNFEQYIAGRGWRLAEGFVWRETPFGWRRAYKRELALILLQALRDQRESCIAFHPEILPKAAAASGSITAQQSEPRLAAHYRLSTERAATSGSPQLSRGHE